MRSNTALFYQFSAAHSLLIGLLPFFLPALIWQRESSLSAVSWFISLSGVGFVIGLFFWDRLRHRHGLGLLLVASFLLELFVVAAIVLDSSLQFLYVIALINGIYGCFFWMAQRLLFAQCTSSNDTGKKFGNFQIIVTIVLKIGILAGGYLWERHGATSVFWVSVAISAPVMIYFLLSQGESHARPGEPAIAPSTILQFRDRKHSRLIFLFDGLFLFTESYFWVLSLYFISGQNFLKLGVLVISLTIILSLVFLLIKNTLDSMHAQRVYVIAVLAYLVSWSLRGIIDTEQHMLWAYPGIVVVAFLTAFFRLAFNKRFFELAKSSGNLRYIVVKSYWSQFGIAVLFAATALVLTESANPILSLTHFYWVLAPLSLLYFLYRAPQLD